MDVTNGEYRDEDFDTMIIKNQSSNCMLMAKGLFSVSVMFDSFNLSHLGSAVLIFMLLAK